MAAPIANPTETPNRYCEAPQKNSDGKNSLPIIAIMKEMGINASDGENYELRDEDATRFLAQLEDTTQAFQAEFPNLITPPLALPLSLLYTAVMCKPEISEEESKAFTLLVLPYVIARYSSNES